MEDFGYIPVSPTDKLHFSCAMCGGCCRNVNASVTVETLDLFRLARFFKISMDEAMAEYTDVWPLTDNGYPVLFLKTTGSDKACVFLKTNHCLAQNAKPRACRTYPLGALPAPDMKSFRYFIVSKETHHYSGPGIRVKEWMDRYFTEEDREFLRLDIAAALEINRLMKDIPAHHEQQMLHSILLLKYVLFDKNADFMPQFIRNMAALKQELKNMTGEKSL